MQLSRRRFLAGVGATTAAFAVKASGPLSNSIANSHPPLVFIPGIKGSILADEHGSVRWFNLAEGLGLESPDLRLPVKWHAHEQEQDGLVATGPLRSVGWHKVYAPFLDWAATVGRPIHAFAYDWRRDNLESTNAFVTFLDKVSGASGGARLQVVAHSMGGLIAFVALTRRPDLFHSILFAGVPFGPSINFLLDMHVGTSNGLNQRILNPPVLFTFVAPYSFFPANPNASRLVNTSGNPITHDWFSAEDWIRERLGIFSDSRTEGVSADQREHLDNALSRARKFRGLLAYQSSVRYPSIAVLASRGYPTLVTAVRNGPRAVRGWDFETAPKQPGDERVYFDGAKPPVGTPYTVFESSRNHDDLLNDMTQVASILVQLCRSEQTLIR